MRHRGGRHVQAHAALPARSLPYQRSLREGGFADEELDGRRHRCRHRNGGRARDRTAVPRHRRQPLSRPDRINDPGIHAAIRLWYYAAPGVAVILAGSLVLSVWRVWLQPLFRFRRKGRLPKWPTSPNDDAPSLVIGETHHPTVARESERPSWLVVPEKGLYTGVLVVGAIGTGKTTACMYPFAKQLLSWRADDPRKRAGALVLEVKGDFCHQVRSILGEAGREEDYLEIGLGGSWQWNPLDDPLLDSYSAAYGVASLINQLFGKSREPFWQQAYTNLVRWIIEVHRILPGGWVTLRDIYRCTVDAELLGRRIGEARELADRLRPKRAVISHEDMIAHPQALEAWAWERVPGTGNVGCRLDPELGLRLDELGVAFETEEAGGGAGREVAEQVEAIERWYSHDWMALDAKLRTSIVEGISVFLSLFDLPDVAGVFCPPPPTESAPARNHDADGAVQPMPGLRRRLPPLAQLIDEGKVLALNMPAGANPALARAIGVLLKNAWMQALLRRPAEAARRPGRYMRPAVFVCDEYQAFATVGQDDPSGDEKAFALTRQCRCIPIVATQSLSSLRSVLPSGEAWRTLVQTLRTRIFLSLSDEASARIASEMCGSVMKTRASHTFTETTGRPEFSLLSGRAGGGRGTIGASKSFRRQREAGVHAARVLAPGQLPGHLSAVRRGQVASGPPRLPEAPLPAEGDGLLAAPREGADMKRAARADHATVFSNTEMSLNRGRCEG